MNIVVLGAVANICAAIGVVGSLIFLAVQINKNTQALSSQVREPHLDRVVTNYARPLDPRVAAVVAAGKKSFLNLNELEKVMFNAWASEYVVSAIHMTIMVKQGLIEAEYARNLDRRIKWLFKNSGAHEWWEYEDRHLFPPGLEAVVNQKIGEMRLKPVEGAVPA